MKIAILLLAGILSIASLLPLVRRDEWWFRTFDFPRLQILVTGLVVLTLFFMFFSIESTFDGIILLTLTACLVLQATRVLPYTPLSPKQVLDAPPDGPDDQAVSLLVANVLMSNRQADRLLDSIERYQPDLVVTLEPDTWWEERLRDLETSYPHTLKEPLDNRYGMLLHSRLPLVNPEIKHLLKDGIPSMHVQVQLGSGDLVQFHFVHPEPPSPTEADESTYRDAELLLVGREVKENSGQPTIVAGDLNDVAWSYTTTLFQKTSGMLDPRRGRGMYNTFHAEYPFMRWPLDHVFHTEHFTLGQMARLPAFGSDHFPVYARLVLQPQAKILQEKPQPAQEDLQQARAKIAKVDQQEDL